MHKSHETKCNEKAPTRKHFMPGLFIRRKHTHTNPLYQGGKDMSNVFVKVSAIAVMDSINGQVIDKEIEIPIEIEYTYDPGDPGKLTGPVEKMYPPEPPELDELEIFLDKEKLADKIAEEMEDELLVAAGEIAAEQRTEAMLERMERDK